MSFLIGIIEQSGGQPWIFKINILFINGELQRGTTSESTCKSFNPVYYNRNNSLPKWVDVTLAWPRELQKNCKTLKTSDPTWVSICCLHFSFKSALVSNLIAVMTF